MARRGERQPKPILGNKSHPESLGTLHVAFLQRLRDRDYAESTVNQRRSYLNDFIEWAEARSLSRPTELTRDVLERYQRHLANRRTKADKPMSFRTQCGHLSALRAWFRWLVRYQHIVHNTAQDLELPRLPHPLPQHVLTNSEAEEIINQTDIMSPLGVRDRSILETFYSTGIRRTELVNLHLHDVDTVRGVLAVRRGKGRKDRMVPIGARALAWLEKYRTEVRPQLLENEAQTALYLTRFGGPFSASYLSKLVSDYVTAAVHQEGSCHRFRHALATSMLEHGADSRFIQAMLGHAKLETTQIYTRVSITKLKEVHERTHPSRHDDRSPDNSVPPSPDKAE
jgi:integrase/recombinase XerD